MLAGAYLQALEQIEAADLPCPVYRTARRLLDRAHSGGGHLRINDDAFRQLCQTEAEGTMRSHLVQLASAGILRYDRRGPTIRIYFAAWFPTLQPLDDIKVIAERSLVKEDDISLIAERSDRALSDQTYVEGDEKVIAERSIRALSDQKSASTSHARSGWLVGSLPSTRKSKKPTNQPQPLNRNDPQQLALGLLVDPEVGIWREVAEILIQKLPAQDIYRTVDDFLADLRDGKVKRRGALRKRLERLQPAAAPGGLPALGAVTLSAGFRESELFHRHRLPDEMIADPERKQYNYMPEPEQRKRYRQ